MEGETRNISVAVSRKIIGIILIVLILVFGWKLLQAYGWLPSFDFPRVGSDWQAVFLTNNQVYFGHLKGLDREYVLLKDIYYLRVAEPLQGAAGQQPTLNLVKLGAELHGPQDAMYIPKDQIRFWENLKDDSQVVQAIKNFAAQQPK